MFDFRAEDDPVGQAMLVVEGTNRHWKLNQTPMAEGGKALLVRQRGALLTRAKKANLQNNSRGDRPQLTPGKRPSQLENDETKTINMVNLNVRPCSWLFLFWLLFKLKLSFKAAVKSLKNPAIKGFLVKQAKKKSDKRFFALSEGYLFYYKTQAVSIPNPETGAPDNRSSRMGSPMASSICRILDQGASRRPQEEVLPLGDGGEGSGFERHLDSRDREGEGRVDRADKQSTGGEG